MLYPVSREKAEHRCGLLTNSVFASSSRVDVRPSSIIRSMVGVRLKDPRNRLSGDPNCELFPQGPITPVPPSTPPYRPVGICGNNWAVSPDTHAKRKPTNQRILRPLFPLFRWWLCSMATPKQHQAVLDGIKTRVQKPVPVIPIGISSSARDCLSMLCLERGRHRIEELPHMVCGVRRMKQPVRHETVPIGRDGFEHGVDVGP